MLMWADQHEFRAESFDLMSSGSRSTACVKAQSCEMWMTQSHQGTLELFSLILFVVARQSIRATYRKKDKSVIRRVKWQCYKNKVGIHNFKGMEFQLQDFRNNKISSISFLFQKRNFCEFESIVHIYIVGHNLIRIKINIYNFLTLVNIVLKCGWAIITYFIFVKFLDTTGWSSDYDFVLVKLRLSLFILVKYFSCNITTSST